MSSTANSEPNQESAMQLRPKLTRPPLQPPHIATQSKPRNSCTALAAQSSSPAAHFPTTPARGRSCGSASAASRCSRLPASALGTRSESCQRPAPSARQTRFQEHESSEELSIRLAGRSSAVERSELKLRVRKFVNSWYPKSQNRDLGHPSWMVRMAVSKRDRGTRSSWRLVN